MKIAKRDQKLLLVLAGLLAFLLLYMLVYNPLQARTEELEAKNAKLSTQVEDLEAKYLRMAEFEAGIMNGRENVKNAMKNYPADVKEEDVLSYLLTMEARQGIRMESVTFNAPQLLQQFNMMVMKDGKDTAIPASAYRTSTVMTGTLTYPQTKNIINYLYDSDKQTSLESTTLTYNAETGKLTGTFRLAKYFVNWDGAEYVGEPVPVVDLGVSDLFGTTSVAPVPAPEVEAVPAT